MDPSQEVQSIDQAIFLERQIKGWTRAKKEALIRGEFDLLPLLSLSAYRRSGR